MNHESPIQNIENKEIINNEMENKDKIHIELNQNKNDNIITNNEDEYTDLAYNLNKNSTSNSIFSSQHVLNSKWVFWYISRKEKDHEIPYSDRLKKIVEFSTIEEFFKYYMFIKSPSDMERNTDLSIFKEAYKPLWESCPYGGCWFIRFKKSEDQNNIDLKWEKILFALIGEQFYDLNLLGSVLSIRGRETVIEIWFNYRKNEIVKSNIGKKMKEILELEPTSKLYFKENCKSIEDKSTLKNAEKYNLNFRQNRKSTNQY